MKRSTPQETWTAAEYQAYLKTKQKPSKANKYNAGRAEYNGRSYDSQGEADYARHLDLMKAAGEVKRVTQQYKLRLEANGIHICDYFIDFRLVMADGSIVLAEFKGMETDLWKQKWAMVKAQLSELEPNATLWLVKKMNGGFEIVEKFTC